MRALVAMVASPSFVTHILQTVLPMAVTVALAAVSGFRLWRVILACTNSQDVVWWKPAEESVDKEAIKEEQGEQMYLSKYPSER
jgi:hypothetical protein